MLWEEMLWEIHRRNRKTVEKTAKAIVDLVEEGHEILIGHGNGPQVGMIQKAFEAGEINENLPKMPLMECGAMSQGYIGYHLQNALGNELFHRGIKKPVTTVITRVLTDPEDEAFRHPSKPIGHFLSPEEVEEYRKQGIPIMEDAGRGFRQVVASPKPVDIAEKDSIKIMMDNGILVIAGGGGGIPVIKTEKGYQGVPAVIDKDFTGEKLAELMDADIFMILTAVEQVALNFGKENQENLSHIPVEDLPKLIQEGHFAKGSMLPKMEAACAFVSKGKGKKAVITSLERAGEALSGQYGTWVE